MATPPAGWNSNISGAANEYQAGFTGLYNQKWVVNVNTQTGQRQVYADSGLLGRSLVATVNADGTVDRNQPNYDNIAALPSGQSRLKEAIDTSGEYANKLVGSIGTEEQKARLAEEKEYSKLKSSLPAPAPGSVPSGNTDQTGPNSGAAAGDVTDTTPSAPLRNVSSFNTTEKNKGYGSWVYPFGINKSQDYLMISTYNYKVADVFAGSDGVSDINSGLILGGASLSSRTTQEFLGSVTLPMPSTISEANQTAWGEDSLSNLTAGLMGGAVGAVEPIANGNLFGVMQQGVETTKDIFKSAGAKSQIKQQLTLNAAAAAVKKLGINVNAEAYRARVTGTVINPNLELLFNGPKLRSFQFSYKLAPRNAGEARQIRGLIRFFKKAMAPKRSGAAGDEFFLGAPNVFKIKFMNGTTKKESTTLPTLKTCALVNFNVNYTADGFYSAYLDGQPVSVQIDLAFAELTPIYNDNYGDNPDYDSVGFPGGSEGADNLENPLFDVKDPSEQAAAASAPQPAAPGPPRGGTSGVVAPVVPVTGGRNPTAIPGDPGYRPPSPGGGLLEGTGTPSDRRGAF